ncbi:MULTISPECIES: hypothetical protein [Bradyrhizobium]|jgi:hypothetical protein|uniref:hypothetical protein n=1 Tax=Bradyrhizobium TaxID=374 RepID=UPI000488817C|nr:MULTISPECIES: hypothetical protein [Bradyrhizobium]MCS3450059.1 hypothetical protein [Bradyrhizobium elkanii]MCS3558796.1 hypothetical protein [Bradyrhizobium elkanii]MCW2151356.1 hypothetical protein [Bradyrhizobium elkanii]MCW2358771.1 hypothetical protein [Bradyrhizobium elkanii]MCW2375087.1 hypothetical protein [Bradyrhizobium elkanii]
MDVPSRGLRLAICFALVLVLPAAQTPPTLHSRDEWRVVDKECRDVLPPQAKIQACLNLLSDRRLPTAYLASINSEISSTFQSLRDYGNAIKYKKIEIERTSAKQLSSSDEALPASFGAMSLRYTELGTLQALNRQTNFGSQSDEARRGATEEQNTYNLALQYNPMNYRAYRYRAEIRSQFCESASAAQDMEAAVRFAEQAGDQDAARDFKRVTLGACVPAWRRD